MLYAFFLFWPANIIPVWLLCILLQFFIPLNMFFRSCCVGNSHYKKHIVAGFIVTVGVAVAMIDVIFSPSEKGLYLNYAMLFPLSSLFDVISHSIKESIVRSQPLNQDKLNIRVAVAQLFVGVLITPIILKISKEYEDYAENPAFDGIETMSFAEFMQIYFTEGFSCLVIMGNPDDTCNFILFYLVAYVGSLFVLQLSLTYLMSAQ